MSAVRLEVETHIVSGAATSVQNLTKCIANANVQIDELVIGALASAEATLTDTEKELGVVVADIGGGTTDIAIFTDGGIYHSAVLPVGAINVTNDVAIGLRTSLNLAEEIKAAWHRQPGRGSAGRAAERGRARRRRRPDHPAPQAVRDHRGADERGLLANHRGGEAIRPCRHAAGGRGAHRWRSAHRRGRRAGAGCLPDAGPGRRAAGRWRPHGPAVEPAFSTPIGLLLWGARHAGEEPMSYATGSSFSGVGEPRDGLDRGDLPG